jgi:MFS family permease
MNNPTQSDTRTAHRGALGVLSLCTLINLASRGVCETFAIFLLPIGAEFDADRAALTGIYATYMLALGFMSPVAGLVIDRLGARVCYATGLGTFGLAFVLAGSAGALWQLYLLVGLGSAVGAAMTGTIPASSLASRWFHARLPTAMGVLSAALGTGILVFAPIAQSLVAWLGWRDAYRTLGGVLLCVLALIMLMPWGRIGAGSPEVMRMRSAAASGTPAWTLGRALRTPVFWSLFGVMFCTSLSTYAINVQLVAYLVDSGIGAFRAASVYGLVGMLSIVGMIAAGVVSERIGEVRFATFSYGSTIVGIGALALVGWWPSALLIGAFALLFGSMQGSRGPLVAVLSARSFAGGRQSGIYGAVLFGMGMGGALGAWGSGALYDLTGGYRAGMLLGAMGAACGLALFVRVPGQKAR